MKNFKFYSKQEIAKLREIKEIASRKERKAAFEAFCSEFKRPIAGASFKMHSLKTRTVPTLKISEESVLNKRELRFSFENPWIDWVNNQIVFPLKNN